MNTASRVASLGTPSALYLSWHQRGRRRSFVADGAPGPVAKRATARSKSNEAPWWSQDPRPRRDSDPNGSRRGLGCPRRWALISIELRRLPSCSPGSISPNVFASGARRYISFSQLPALTFDCAGPKRRFQRRSRPGDRFVARLASSSLALNVLRCSPGANLTEAR